MASRDQAENNGETGDGFDYRQLAIELIRRPTVPDPFGHLAAQVSLVRSLQLLLTQESERLRVLMDVKG